MKKLIGICLGFTIVTTLILAMPHVPATAAPMVDGTGLTAEYFDGTSFSTHKIARIDPAVNFDWGSGTPDAAISSPDFSARWSGYVVPRYSGSYTLIFTIGSYTSMYVRINGANLQWQYMVQNEEDPYVVATAHVTFSAEQQYEIEVGYSKATGNGLVKLEWLSTLQMREVIPMSRLYPKVVPQAPGRNFCVSTGSGKVSAFIDKVPDATGYNFYRGTSATTIDFSAPVNGSPITSDSYTNSPMVLFTDTGRTNGQEYFYVAKAVYDGGIQSSPSPVDSDVVDPAGVPWDSRDPGPIIAALTALSTYEDIGDGVRAMAPDGSIYESDVSGQSPPDATVEPGLNVWALRAGGSIATPEEDTAGVPEIPKGPTRRVRTVAGQFVKVSFEVVTPDRQQVDVHPYLYSSRINKHGQSVSPSSFDTPYIYLGSRAVGGEVDAGLMYQRPQGQGDYYWRPFMIVSGKADPVNIAGGVQGNSPSQGPLGLEPGHRAKLVYWIQRLDGVQSRKSHVYLKVIDLDTGKQVGKTLPGVVNHAPGVASLRLKRCVTIAQVLQGTDASVGYRKTGSYVLGTIFQNGRLYSIATLTTGLLWTPDQTSDALIHPMGGDPPIVHVSAAQPDYEETVSMDLRP